MKGTFQRFSTLTITLKRHHCEAKRHLTINNSENQIASALEGKLNFLLFL
jgi:hypothetical protein